MANRAFHSNIFRCIISFSSFLFTVSIVNQLNARPILNQQDPIIFHSIRGSDKYYDSTNKTGVSFQISPFYTHTHSANDYQTGTKTSDGNVLGQWNMAGLFLNNQVKPTSGSYTYYNQTQSFLKNLGNQPKTLEYSHDYTNESTFNPEETAYQAVMYKDVSTRFEKAGVRFQFNFDLGMGLGVSAKTGVANMKNSSEYFGLEPGLSANAGLSTSTEVESATATQSTQALNLYNALLSLNARRQLFKEIGIDYSSYNVTDFEDFYGNVYWNFPIKIKEQDELVCSVIPYLSVGIALPIAKNRDYDRLFAVVNGSDSFTGLTADASIALDFPEMFQFSTGCGVTLYNTLNQVGYRVPTSQFQSGIYPWTTTISRQPGPLWYLNFSMKADNIMSKKVVPNISVYFDYVYAEHMHDDVTVKSPNAANDKYFLPEMLERDSTWKAQALFAGVQFAVSKNVSMGIATQGSLSGVRTFRPTTIMTSIMSRF